MFITFLKVSPPPSPFFLSDKKGEMAKLWREMKSSFPFFFFFLSLKRLNYIYSTTKSSGSEVNSRHSPAWSGLPFFYTGHWTLSDRLPPPLKPCTAVSFSKYGYFLGRQILVSLTELNCVHMYLGQLHWPYLVGVNGFQMV